MLTRAAAAPRIRIAAWILVAGQLWAGAAWAGDAEDYAESALVVAEQKYLETDFDGADEVLRTAIAGCEEEKCKPKLMTKLLVLHADVLATGLKRRDDAKAEMRAALAIDPKLELPAEMDSKELHAIYQEARAELEPRTPSPRPKKKPKPEKTQAAPEEPAPEEKEIRRNWIRGAFMVDLTLLLAEADTCAAATQEDKGWACARSDGSPYHGVPTRGRDDQVATGMRLSTMRALLGYERVLGDNFTLGLHVGFAFRPLESKVDAKFLPLHLEGRAAYWFRDEPFRDIVRPNVFLAAGLGQVDSLGEVVVVEDALACGAPDPVSGECTRATDPDRSEPEKRAQNLDVEKRAGPGFVALGLGLSFSPTPLVMIDVAARFAVTFPVFTPVLSPEAGVSFGF